MKSWLLEKADAEDDEHALEIVRSIIATLPVQPAAPWERRRSRPPLEDPDGLLDVVPLDPRTPYEVHGVLRRIVERDYLGGDAESSG